MESILSDSESALFIEVEAFGVAWRVIEHDSSSVALSTYRDLLKRVSRLMPRKVKIVLLADRGFTDGQLLRYLKTQLNWQSSNSSQKRFLVLATQKRLVSSG